MIKLQCLLYEKLNMKTIYHLFRIPYSFFDNRSQGNILFRLGLLEQVQNIITSSLIQMIIALTSFLVVTVYFFSTLPEIIPLIIGIVFFIGIYVLTIGKFLIKKRKEELEVSEKVNNIVTEIVVNMFQIKCLHLEHYFSDRYTYRFNNLKDKFKNHQTYSATFSLFINVFATFIPVVLVVFLISSDKYNFSVGQIFVVYTLLGTLLTYVTNFFNELTSFRLLRTSLYYLNDMLDEPEVNNSYNEKINSFESIHVDNVSFAYNDMSESILKSIDIKVKKGDKVAIVGNSGSGKTTLVKLLTRLYLPTKGNIYINGIDYSYIDPNIYGSIIAVVPQIPITFNKTIRDNITLEDKNIDDGKIIKALKIANFYNEVKSMPMGLNTFLSGQGGNLSGGQIQRLALARALVREPELLILDESTSSLDSINENKIYENLNKENITTIVISHRLSTVKDANVIYVISLGNVVEYGSHVELMKKQGIYSNMFAQQDPA